jgi:hypothetical protein
LIGLLQERYGYARDKAETEYQRWSTAEGTSWTATKSKAY